VSWELQRHFIDPTPYTFQLQVGHTADQAAADWVDVGAPVIDTFFTVDPTKRMFGSEQELHYRVELTTSVDTYLSEPFNTLGALSKRDWLHAREILRKEQLRHRIQTSSNGFLLKAIRYGPVCTDCTDPLTGEVNNSHCGSCFGTGKEGGYFRPLAASFADLSTSSAREHINPQTATTMENVVQGRFVADPQLYSYDVWVDESGDARYYIHKVDVAAHIRGVPIIYNVEMRIAQFSDIIYTYPMVPSVPPEPRHP